MAIVLITGGLLLPMGVIRVAAEMRQSVYPPATGDGAQIAKTGDQHAGKTKDKGSGGFSQVTTGTLESGVLALSDADLAITKTQLTEFNIGPAGGIFVINIKNISTNTYTGSVLVRDAFPIGSLTPTVVWSFDPQLESCNISSNLVACVYTTPVVLSPGQSLNPIQIAVDVAELAFPEVTNIAHLLASDIFTNNNKSAITVRIQSADLEIDKDVSDITPKTGETIIYTITVTNKGPDYTTNVIISDTLPTGIKYKYDNPSAGYYSPSTGRWSGVNLLNGISETLIITAEVEEGTAGETITNTAEVLATDCYDPDDTNDSASATIVVIGTDLQVLKTDDFTYIYPGLISTYTISITNAGELTATGVTITDVLGSDYTYISDTLGLADTHISSNIFVWDYPDAIIPAESISFRISVEVNQTINDPIDLTNTITVTSKADNEMNEDNTSMDRNLLSDFEVEKMVTPTSATVGQILRFSTIISNTGESELKNLIIQDQYPSELDILSTIPTRGKFNNNNKTIIYTINSLQPKQQFTINIDTIVNSSARGSVSRISSAIVDAETPDGKPDLQLKTASVSFMIIGTEPYQVFFPIIMN